MLRITFLRVLLLGLFGISATTARKYAFQCCSGNVTCDLMALLKSLRILCIKPYFYTIEEFYKVYGLN